MSQELLIKELISQDYLKTPSIIEAFKKIDRADFVPDEIKSKSYLNRPLPIGEGQTISQPIVVAFMIEYLMPKPGDKILDIGTGSGWQAALLAEVVGGNKSNKKGKVISIERIPGLADVARNNIKKYGFIDKGDIDIIVGDGSKGFETDAPYDGIIAAASGGNIPEPWKSQLKIGGKIVAPVKNSIIVMKRVDGESWEEQSFFGFSFVPLVAE